MCPMFYVRPLHYTIILLSVLFLTHWGRVTHICVGKLTIIGSGNGSSPQRRQAIIWTNAGILLIGPLGTNFNEILIEIQTFSLKKIRLKMSSAKCCSFRLGLNVLSQCTCFCFAKQEITVSSNPSLSSVDSDTHMSSPGISKPFSGANWYTHVRYHDLIVIWLTHCGLVIPQIVRDLDQHWIR